MINLFVRKRILLAIKIACHVPAILPKKKAEYEYNIFFQKSRQEISICNREIVEKFAPIAIEPVFKRQTLAFTVHLRTLA